MSSDRADLPTLGGSPALQCGRDVSDPWIFDEYVPGDPVVRELATRTIGLSGGQQHDRGYRHDPIPEVSAALTEWFHTTIPDAVNAGADDQRAIKMQAVFLCHAEGSPLHGWERAVTDHYPRLCDSGYFYRRGASFGCTTDILADRYRGMRLYALAFSRLADEMGVQRVKVYRRLGRAGARSIVAATPIANVSWHPDHTTFGGPLFEAWAHPGAFVGITLYREMHPLLTPFDLWRGPDRSAPLVWRRAALERATAATASSRRITGC